MSIATRKAAAGLAAGALTLAGAAPAIASNTGEQPQGPPLWTGNPASISSGPSFTPNGALVLHCISPANGGSAGVALYNATGYHVHNPGDSC